MSQSLRMLRTIVILLSLCSIQVNANAHGPSDDELRLCVRLFQDRPERYDNDAQHSKILDIKDDVLVALSVSRALSVIPCHLPIKAYAFEEFDMSNGIRPGEYIVYGTTWVREVAGSDETHIKALFGHEIGHFLNDHFRTRRAIFRSSREEEADRFAGCVVARLGGEWDEAEDLFERIRAQDGTNYPDRNVSIRAARLGFEACDGNHPVDHVTAAEQSAWDQLVPGNCNGLRGYIREYPGGVYAQRAANMIVARRVTEQETWEPREVSLPLSYRESEAPSASEEEAQAAALGRAQYDADIACGGLAAAAATYRLNASVPSPDFWTCESVSEGTACSFRGKAVCVVEVRGIERFETC